MKRCPGCGATFLAEDWRCPRCGHEPALVDGFRAFAPEIAAGAAGYDAAHFAQLAQIEAGSFWYRARNRLVSWALRRYFPAARSFFEAGCGSGFVLAGVAAAYPGLRLTASEAAVAGLANASMRVPRAALFQADARRLPWCEEFDVAGAFDVIEHIVEDDAVLQSLHEALVPGGGLLLTVPQHPFLWSEFDARSGHVRRYRAAALRAQLQRAGFEILRMTSFMSLTLLPMLLSRLRPPRADYDPVDQLRLPRWLDAMLSAALAVERAAIRAGLSLPMGGSLLVVARKT